MNEEKKEEHKKSSTPLFLHIRCEAEFFFKENKKRK
jgi:hypothetical protein